MQNQRHTKRLVGPCAAAVATLLMGAAITSPGIAQSAPKETGVWIDDTGRGATKIEVCGTKLCGRVVWLKELVNDKGEPLIDRHNPDESLRKRPICGLPVLGQLEAMSEGGYDGGWVYDPKEGKSYSVAIQLTSNDTLSVTGYLGVKFLGKTLQWTRAKAELPSCDSAAAAPAEVKTNAIKTKTVTTTTTTAVGTPAVKPAAAATAVVPAPPLKKAATTGATAAPSAATTAKIKKTKATPEVLPWSDEAAAAKAAPAKKPAAAPSQLGAAKVKPAPKKPQVPAELTSE